MSRLMLLSGLLMLVGCASTGGASSSGEPALPLGLQNQEPLVVRGSSITGPSSSLTIHDNAMRGRFRDQPVSVRWTYQEITGMVVGLGTRLELAEGDDTRIWGSIGGIPVDLTLEQGWVYGRVGLCEYAMRRTATGFLGRRGCSGPLEPPFHMSFPDPLMERPLGEKSMLLTLMLLNQPETYSPSISPARLTPPHDAINASR